MGDPPIRYICWQRIDSGHPGDRSPSHPERKIRLRTWTGKRPVVGSVSLKFGGRGVNWCNERGCILKEKSLGCSEEPTCFRCGTMLSLKGG